MRSIERTTQFKRDYKREKRTNARLDEILMPVITMLRGDEELPERLRDHSLGGTWKGFRDCHVKPDLVLIYARNDSMLTLVRLGSHSELFE
ncbi:type II toxin-antitoxin system YafQ family toxin [Arenibaculum sp.]|uniref:type II toxin-antitoxin system YafQ family toxin n=1 Tax=Arenibaculum sp. TaxID=2865862 RepID=UPI002E0F228B|nr:type II toxin-antitoxin system YafQ family toxin [Arenibaculum sp.]